jgi:hypothetical protein
MKKTIGREKMKDHPYFIAAVTLKNKQDSKYIPNIILSGIQAEGKIRMEILLVKMTEINARGT